MKIVVIGGAGLIGAKLVKNLRDRGHDVVAASRASGIDVISGKGLAAAMAGRRSWSTWRIRRRSRMGRCLRSLRRRGGT